MNMGSFDQSCCHLPVWGHGEGAGGGKGKRLQLPNEDRWQGLDKLGEGKIKSIAEGIN